MVNPPNQPSHVALPSDRWFRFQGESLYTTNAVNLYAVRGFLAARTAPSFHRIPAQKQFLLSEKLIKSQLKALIAQKLWDLTAFFKVINQYDEEVIKAVEVIRNDGMFKKYQIQP